MSAWDNESIAEKLLEFADLLEQQNANPYRVSAYRRAAAAIRRTLKAIEAGRESFLAGRIPRKRFASASSPVDGTFF